MTRPPHGLRYSDVTPRQVYLNRRRFLAAGAASAGSLALPSARGTTRLNSLVRTPYNVGNEKLTSHQIVTTYNNFYEFGTGKDDPAQNAPRWKLDPAWKVRIEGEVIEPMTLDLDQILKLAPLEERIYRHRCVEGWSIVVPWVGFSLSALLKQAEPTGKAKYVEFESYYNSRQMLSSRAAGIQFPYVEGLRLDEAIHPLALLAVGLYGETLPNQNGAPLRLVLPWKYGFKSIKSITRIRFTAKQPDTTWGIAWPEAYGFYSNVNPQKDHPNHSQREEIRLGMGFLGQRRVTLLFNGYTEVADLYRGMDLRKFY